MTPADLLAKYPATRKYSDAELAILAKAVADLDLAHKQAACESCLWGSPDRFVFFNERTRKYRVSGWPKTEPNETIVARYRGGEEIELK